MTSMAQTNSSPLRRWMVPPFLTNRATAPRRMASPPAATWIGRSMRPRSYEQPRTGPSVAPLAQWPSKSKRGTSLPFRPGARHPWHAARMDLGILFGLLGIGAAIFSALDARLQAVEARRQSEAARLETIVEVNGRRARG